MNNIKSIPSHIRKGGVVAMYTTCGLGLLVLPTNSSVLKLIMGQLTTVGTREECLLICNKTPINRYIGNLPEMAMTLLELSDKALTLQFEDWSKSEILHPFYPNGLSIRMVLNSDEAYIVNGVGQPLLFIPITQKELSIFKKIESGDFLFEIVSQDQPKGIVEKPGIISFFANGSMKILRE